MTLLTVVIIIAMVMTVAVLLMGLGSMVHGGEFDEKHSHQFMFARVAMQAVTLLLLLVAVFLANN
jgi:preprotein translocase subunit SecG